MSIKIGSIYQTNNCGDIVVIEKCGNTDKYKIQFVNTGTIKVCRGFCILEGSVRDPFARNFRGVACTGNVKTKGKNKVYYSIWHDMIERCYNAVKNSNTSYKNVTVCERWLVFENFLNDVSLLDNFDDANIRSGNLVLDKDTKQRFLKNKVYSPDTCIWLNKSENNKIQDHQQRIFYAKSPEGEIFLDYNITDFAKKHNLERKHISGCLHGRCKTHKGWKFSYEEIV